MSIIIIPILTMAVGFLMGVVTMDTYCDNKRINDLERKLKLLERMVRG